MIRFLLPLLSWASGLDSWNIFLLSIPAKLESYPLPPGLNILYFLATLSTFQHKKVEGVCLPCFNPFFWYHTYNDLLGQGWGGRE